nr:MAG TPA: hypothetical protein [Caudoviricetes sp.]
MPEIRPMVKAAAYGMSCSMLFESLSLLFTPRTDPESVFDSFL